MTKNLKISLNSFFWLVWRNIRALKTNFLPQVIDLIILINSLTLIYTYVMPSMGLKLEFGLFMMLSQVLCSCVWGIQSDSSGLVTDIEGTKAISYELTLPMPYWLVYIKTALVYAIKSTLLNIINIPIGLLLICGRVDWSQISIFKFLLVYPLVNIFFGFFCLLVAVYTKGIINFNRFWMRWGAQLFFFSGFFFPWFTLFGISKILAYINLFNPLIYPFEAIHIPFTGQSGYINFWLCLLAIILFTLIFAWIGIKIFKKRLDCI